MHRSKFIIVFVIMAIICIAGCSDKPETSSIPETIPRKGSYRVINMPRVLTGDAALLARHLRRRIIGVKIIYDGPKKFLNVGYDTWHNGKLIKKDSWNNRDWESVSNNNVLEKTFSIGSSSKSGIVVATGNGQHVGDGTTVISSLDMPHKRDEIVNILQNYNSIEISDDKEVAICGFVWYPSGTSPIPLFGDIEKRAKKADYAIIFKIGFSNSLERPDYWPESWKQEGNLGEHSKD